MGSLETRVLASARRFLDLGVTSDELAAVPPIDRLIPSEARNLPDGHRNPAA